MPCIPSCARAHGIAIAIAAAVALAALAKKGLKW